MSIRIPMAAIAVLLLDVLPGSSGPVRAELIISPPSAATVDGTMSITPSLSPLRVQHLIPASTFANLPSSHRWIVSFNYRADQQQSQSIDWTYGDESIWMSTTTLHSLGSTFDNNHGADKTKVHDGGIVYRLLGTGPAAGPRDVAEGTPLDSPFFFDPSQGNLLIERMVTASDPSILAHIDTTSSDLIRLLINDEDPKGATGTPVPGSQPVLQLRFAVPEPALAGYGLLAFCPLVAARRRCGRHTATLNNVDS
jgi:hypothetical protein